MITFDQLCSTLLGAEPRAALDQLVRDELSAGRKTNAIYDELLSHVDALRSTPGYTDEIEDVLGDTMDALCGWVHPDYAYKDPPEPVTLPTEEEIEKLPAWARVAFAARCVRRVLPLLRAAASPGAEEQHNLVAQAVSAVERAATETDRSKATHEKAWYNTACATKWYNDAGLPVQSGIAEAGYEAAMLATTGGSLGTPNGDIYHKAMTQPAHRLVAETVAAMGEDITPQIRRDYEMLLQRAAFEKWTDDTPVPPSVFGPLWPNGPPPKWPSIEDDAR